MNTTARPEAVPSTNGANGQTAAQTTAAGRGNGRDTRGRFTKGNPGGPGNPFARRLAAIRKAFYDAFTDKDVKAVAGKLLEMARAGDPAALRTFLEWGLGKPPEPVNPDTIDQQELQQLRHLPDGRVLHEGIDHVRPGVLLAVFRKLLEVGEEHAVGKLL